MNVSNFLGTSGEPRKKHSTEFGEPSNLLIQFTFIINAIETRKLIIFDIDFGKSRTIDKFEISRAISFQLTIEKMSVVLQRTKYGQKTVRVPQGLKELMSDISREVIRKQPDDMEEFIANYLENVLKTREKIDSARKNVDEVLDTCINIKELLEKIGLSVDQARLAGEIISTAFNEHVAKLQDLDEKNVALREVDIVVKLIDNVGLSLSQARKTARIMQELYKKFYFKNLKKFEVPDLDSEEIDKKHWSILERAKVLRAPDLEVDCHVPKLPNWMQPKFEKRELAATVIQAVYRGKQVRTSFRCLMDECELQKMPNWMKPKFERRERAAIVFQKVYRGKLARNDYKKMREAATTIQSAFKGFKVRMNRNVSFCRPSYIN
jgi:hypothetical protein